MILEIFVCDTYVREYKKVIEDEGYTDVFIKPFPCFCSNKGLSAEKYQSQLTKQPNVDQLIICSKNCTFIKFESDSAYAFKIESSDYCYSHWVNDALINSIIQTGGYIVTSGWLKNWKSKLEKEQFTKLIARRFYSDFCRQIVFLDTGIDDTAQDNLIEFSEYIDRPYKRIYIGLDSLKIFLRSIVFEWRLKHKDQNLVEAINDSRRQTAEYSAVLNIIEKIAKNTKKRDVINTLIEMFQSMFGAKEVCYVDEATNYDYIVARYSAFIDDSNLEYLLSEENNSLIIKIQHNNELFGIIEASDFLFPKHLKNYTNFAISISRVTALVFSNVKQYEALEKVKDEITYSSHHDLLTGLYNRNYYIEYIANNQVTQPTIFYMCDIDGLKKVNDTLGHSYGDELIRMAANTLIESVRETDFVFRIGGDEFVIIQKAADLEIAEKTKMRIEEAIKQKNNQFHDKLPFTLSLSFGYAMSSETNGNWKKLEEESDRLMYEAKMLKRQ